MSKLNNNVWLIGAGGMAVDYARVLRAMQLPTQVIGRGQASAAIFQEKSGLAAWVGGLETFLATRPPLPGCAIVSVGMEALAGTTSLLLAYGVRRILIEKPGALNKQEITLLAAQSDSLGAEVFIAYNRRMYASTLRAQQIIGEDGGVQSMNFEFTEWSHVIGGLSKADGVKPAWLLANSTHVIDLAFYLGGTPTDWSAYVAGTLDWHPASSRFAGAGVTDRDVLFSYQANWDAPGRWAVEILTPLRRLIFKPMESLQVVRKGSVSVEPVEIDDAMDKAFKPGLHEQVRRFVQQQDEGLCALKQQMQLWDAYVRMAGYAA